MQTKQAMWDAFAAEYLTATSPLELVRSHITDDAGKYALTAIGYAVRLLDYSEHAMTAGDDAQAASYVECAIDGTTFWGAGIDASILTASLHTVVSAINRAHR